MNIKLHHCENLTSFPVCSLLRDEDFLGVIIFLLGFSKNLKHTKIISFKSAGQLGVKQLSTLATM
jgi:hypothetical protein